MLKALELGLFVSVGITFLGAAGSEKLRNYFVQNDKYERTNQEWYLHLKKPALNPPDWLFLPVWLVLYCCMSVAAFLVWRDGDGFDGCAAGALFLYGVQLLLNWTWTPLFFGLHRVFDGVALLLLLNFFITASLLFMFPVNSNASYLMVPYLLWTMFATYLNLAIWQANCSRSNNNDNNKHQPCQ